MRNEFYYIIAKGEYGQGFLDLDGEMSVVLVPVPRLFGHKGAAEVLAEHFMAEYGGKAVVRAAHFSP